MKNTTNFLKKSITTKLAAGAIAFSAVTGITSFSSELVPSMQASASTSVNKIAPYKAVKYVNSDDGYLNVRKSYSVSSAKKTTANTGKKVKVTYKIKKSDGSTWMYVTFSGKNGWVNAQYLSNTRPAKQATSVTKTSNSTTIDSKSEIVSYAQRFTGVRYVWGGTTTSGFDCSGLTQYSYRNSAGITIPRTAAAQYSASKKISQSEARPGDLVFFSGNGRSITHVGIYAGNGYMTHASTSKGVTTGSINDGYWNKRFVGFGRFF